MVFDVPAHMWVHLAQAAKSDNRDIAAGQTCSLLKGGHVEIIGTDSEYGTLVRYSLPAGERAAGALCPNGALVFLPPDTVKGWPAYGEVGKNMQAAATRRADVVTRLLKGL